MTLFAAENVAINFGGIRAVDGVSFEVEAGQVFTIIGPNGAGKTTIFNLVSRIYDPSQGRLLFEGNDITGIAPHQIARRGIARTFQNIELFEHATVLQNLLLGRHTHKTSRFVGELLFLPRVRALEIEHRDTVDDVVGDLGDLTTRWLDRLAASHHEDLGRETVQVEWARVERVRLEVRDDTRVEHSLVPRAVAHCRMLPAISRSR